MNLLLWGLQILLALIFLLHGSVLVIEPASMQKELVEGFSIFSKGFQQFIGVAELLASLGLILPGLTKIATWLTPLAALGLIPIMIGAAWVHMAHREMPKAIGCAVIMLLIILVGWLRWQVFPLVDPQQYQIT